MNNKKLYTLANFIIYSLITVLIILITYNALILYKKYKIPKIPQNSINVSPNYNDGISDVLVND